MKQLEIERKFLIKFPTSWSTLAELFDGLVDVKRISQTYLKPEGKEPYLKPEGKEPCGRVRKTIQGLTGDIDTIYDYNIKKFVENGINEETENEISKSEFQKYLKNSHPDKVTVYKTRFVFKYNDQIFELDVFKGPLKGIAILEIELKSKKDKVELPPFLKVIKEVTKDNKWNNFELASKKNS